MRCTIILFLCSFVALSYGAQQPQHLPKVVVKASLLPQPTTLDTSDKTVITDRDLEREQAVTLVDALQRVPGVYVTQDGGIGQKASVSLRGSSTGQTAVIIDGMHINDVSADNGAVDLSVWMIDDFAEIQVIRGPFSSLYGSDAIGGVVLIDTKKGKGPFTLKGRAEAGSFSTYQQVFGCQGQKDLMDYQLTASRIQSAGSPLTPDRFRSQINGKANDPLHQENFSTRLGMGTDTSHISLFSRYVTRRLGFRNRFQAWAPWRQNMTESFNRLKGHFEKFDGKWVHEFGIALYTNDRENINPLNIKDGENKGSQTQIDWRQSLQINERVQAQIGTEFVQERFFTQRLTSSPNKAKNNHGGLSGVLCISLLDNLLLSTAIRLDKYIGLPSVATYRAGMEYSWQDFTFKGGVGTGFKAPTLAQRFYRSLTFSGNPNLKPERSLGWDFGVEYALLQKRVTVGMTIFQNRIRDMIAWGGKTNINIERVRTQGFEALIKFQFNNDWLLNLSHTYTQAVNEQTHLTLVRRPLNKTTLEVVGQLSQEWQISSDVLYVGRQVDFDAQNYPKRVRMPSYTILGIQTSYKLNDIWQVYGRGENMLDHRYENPNGFQQPGLGVYVGLRAQC